jgi:hypothetical protein
MYPDLSEAGSEATVRAGKSGRSFASTVWQQLQMSLLALDICVIVVLSIRVSLKKSQGKKGIC